MRFDNDKEINLKNNKERDRFYKKMSEEQKLFFHSIKGNIFTFCEAVAGTGKSHVSVAAMVDMLANGEIDKIVYIQKASERYLEHGFLPGGIEEKTEALWTPFYDAMLTLGYFPETVSRMVQQGIIYLTTDSTLRGVNLENAGVILDEAQNCNEETLKLIFTRCHDSCHVVMIGDIKQKDNHGNNADFVAYGDYLANSKLGNKCYLTKNYRGKFSQLAEDFGGLIMNKYRVAFNVDGKINYITVDATYYVRQEGFVDFIRIKEDGDDEEVFSIKIDHVISILKS